MDNQAHLALQNHDIVFAEELRNIRAKKIRSRRYSTAFKRSIMDLHVNSNITYKDLAKKFNINAFTLSNWGKNNKPIRANANELAKVVKRKRKYHRISTPTTPTTTLEKYSEALKNHTDKIPVESAHIPKKYTLIVTLKSGNVATLEIADVESVTELINSL